MKLRWVTLLLFCLQTAVFATEGNSVQYEISSVAGNDKVLKVVLNYTAVDNQLYMANGANQFDDRWAEFISDIKATSDGQSVEIDYRGNASWQLDARRGQNIRIEYLFHFDHEEHRWSSGIDGAAYRRPGTMFAAGRAIFILPGQNTQPINVQFKLPADWDISTPWLAAKNQKNQFQVESLEELTQAGFMIGKFSTFTIERNGFELVFALGTDRLASQADTYKNLGQGVFDYYIKLMGGTPNIPETQNQKCLIIVGEDKQTDGEVLGNTISILMNLDGGQMEHMLARFIFAHEFFHLWNGKSFAPDSDDLEWFKEGFTNYYTMKSLIQVGAINDEALFAVMNDLFYQRYINDDGIKTIPLTNGAAKHNHWGIIYGGGMFAGISMDMIIRNATNNKSSLDQVMRGIFTDYAGSGNLLSLNELRSRLSKAAGRSQNDFFESYVQKAQRIPIEKYLELGGMKATLDGNQLRIQRDDDASALEKEILTYFLGKID